MAVKKTKAVAANKMDEGKMYRSTRTSSDHQYYRKADTVYIDNGVDAHRSVGTPYTADWWHKPLFVPVTEEVAPTE